MGNVPISCCRSKSPKLNRSSSLPNSNSNTRTSSNRHHDKRYHQANNKSSQSDINNHHQYEQQSTPPSHILQHISEREPDDSETDPSSNPFNRPIFATRSSSKINKELCGKTHHSDSYSSNNSARNRQQSLLMSSNSQDHGYNSTSSTTNLTHLDGLQLNDSFESNSNQQHRQQQANQYNKQNIDNNGEFSLTISQSINNLNLAQSSSVISSYSDVCKKRIRTHLAISNQESRYLAARNCLKASSCSTIFLDGSTISQPDLEQTIKCVSLAIYYHIKNRVSDNTVEIFDETIHPLKMPANECNVQKEKQLLSFDQTITGDEPDYYAGLGYLNESNYNDSDRGLVEPQQRTIYNFVRTLFKAAQLTSEYAITTLVYLERLMTYGEMDLTPKTWRRMFLGAILLSSKVWEDQAVWNVDYAQILEEISVEDINELERQFLELIQFNMNVPSSVYAKYYFHLRTLAAKNQLSLESKQLTVENARKLEAMTRIFTNNWQSSPIHRKTSSTLKRYASLEKSRLNGWSKAILM